MINSYIRVHIVQEGLTLIETAKNTYTDSEKKNTLNWTVKFFFSIQPTEGIIAGCFPKNVGCTKKKNCWL